MRSAARHADYPVASLILCILALPTPLIRSLTHNLIDHLDRLDGDPDLEDGGDAEAIDEREPENLDLREASSRFGQIRLAGR